MLLTEILPWKREALWQSSEKDALTTKSLSNKGKTIPYEMDVHVPCHVIGITRNGSRWVGQTSTLSIGSYGARLLLPYYAKLEGDVTLSFKVPAPLEFLFFRNRFRTTAEVKNFGVADPSISANDKMEVCVVFEEPLYFNLKEKQVEE